MRPVRALIGNATQLLLSPDGALNLIPFEALLDEEGRFLIERYSSSYLTSGRDLLRLGVGRPSQGAILVMAAPSFGEPLKAGASSKAYFPSLEETAQEARAIKRLFPEARVVTGDDATESVLKSVDRPRILHIATHGFFLRNATNAATNDEENRIATRAMSSSVVSDNPLLRSGLALSGANLNRGGTDDGILTALEASGLNLWGTKLVTLSACDTGLGEVENREGVYGLRRAFVLAGAETLVMSLWPVSDYATREMMTGYYEGLRRNQGRGEALRQVKLQMLKRKDRQHPFYWASFIQAGEWASLEGKR
jgi:CHAT domain-containing protein